VVSENTVQLTEPGKYFANLGFYVEYGQSVTTSRNAGPNQVTFGPLIAKNIGRTIHTVNLFLTRELGPNRGPHGLDFAYMPGRVDETCGRRCHPRLRFMVIPV
jgi:hypothetical protein